MNVVSQIKIKMRNPLRPLYLLIPYFFIFDNIQALLTYNHQWIYPRTYCPCYLREGLQAVIQNMWISKLNFVL